MVRFFESLENNFGFGMLGDYFNSEHILFATALSHHPPPMFATPPSPPSAPSPYKPVNYFSSLQLTKILLKISAYKSKIELIISLIYLVVVSSIFRIEDAEMFAVENVFFYGINTPSQTC